MQCRTINGYETVGITSLRSCIRFGKKLIMTSRYNAPKKKKNNEKQCYGTQSVVLGRTRKAEITDTFDPEQGSTLYRNIF